MTIDGKPSCLFHQACRPDRIAHAPARHRVGLAPAIQHDHAIAQLGKAKQADVLAPAIKHLAIDLVAEDGEVGIPGEARHEFGDLGFRIRPASRIGRAVDDDEARPGRDQGEQLVG